MNEKKDQIRKDFDEFLTKHNIKQAILMCEQPIDGEPYRVIAASTKKPQDECDYAKLVQSCLNMSSGLLGIFEHMSIHSIHDLIHDVQVLKGGKKVG